jgi:hypothetical protein
MTQHPDTTELVLPTFAVLARFREQATAPEAAVRAVTARLTEAQEPFHEVDVEREDAPGTYLVVARFVLVSIDGQTALAGLHDTLVAAGLAPDEVWLDGRVS